MDVLNSSRKTGKNTLAIILCAFIFLSTCSCYQQMNSSNSTTRSLATDSSINNTKLRAPNHNEKDNCNSSGADAKCGTIEYLGCTGSKKFYHESAIKMSWFDAWEYCRSIGLHLAVIDSQYEQTFIELFLPPLDTQNTETYWTSGTDLGKEGIFTWMTTGRSFSFTNFRQGEPNNRFGSENCIELIIKKGVIGFLWNDRNCHARGYALCQQDSRYPDNLIDETHD